MRRFIVAYVAAASSATAAVLAVQAVEALGAGLGIPALHDFAETAVLYLVYSLGFTLVLGLVGWAVLRGLRLSGALPYGLTGAILGLLAAALGGPGFDLDNPLLYSYSVGGFAAALTFRWLYYRRAEPRKQNEAAA